MVKVEQCLQIKPLKTWYFLVLNSFLCKTENCKYN